MGRLRIRQYVSGMGLVVSAGCGPIFGDELPLPLPSFTGGSASSAGGSAPLAFEIVACGNTAINAPDADRDGFADPAASVLQLSPVECYLASKREQVTMYQPDCNDNDPAQHDFTFVDADGDGLGDIAQPICVGAIWPSGVVSNFADCDDTDATRGLLMFPDTDGDGYGSTDFGEGVCPPSSGLGGAGMSSSEDDCNDEDAAISPLGADIPGDGMDGDCDGQDDGRRIGSGSSPLFFVDLTFAPALLGECSALAWLELVYPGADTCLNHDTFPISFSIQNGSTITTTPAASITFVGADPELTLPLHALQPLSVTGWYVTTPITLEAQEDFISVWLAAEGCERFEWRRIIVSPCLPL